MSKTCASSSYVDQGIPSASHGSLEADLDHVKVLKTLITSVYTKVAKGISRASSDRPKFSLPPADRVQLNIRKRTAAAASAASTAFVSA